MAQKDKNNCWVTVFGYSGAAFVAMAACSDNLQKYLFGTGSFWILSGTFVAGCWAYEKYCEGMQVDE